MLCNEVWAEKVKWGEYNMNVKCFEVVDKSSLLN